MLGPVLDELFQNIFNKRTYLVKEKYDMNSSETLNFCCCRHLATEIILFNKCIYKRATKKDATKKDATKKDATKKDAAKRRCNEERCNAQKFNMHIVERTYVHRTPFSV